MLATLSLSRGQSGTLVFIGWLLRAKEDTPLIPTDLSPKPSSEASNKLAMSSNSAYSNLEHEELARLILDIDKASDQVIDVLDSGNLGWVDVPERHGDSWISLLSTRPHPLDLYVPVIWVLAKRMVAVR